MKAVDQVNAGSGAARKRRAEAIYSGLRLGGVGLCVSLPDSVLLSITRLVEADSEIQGIRCTREDEGVALAIGAWLGGQVPVVLMEGSGVGHCGLILARAQACRMPVLLLASHNKLLAEEYDYHLASAHAAEAVLRGLDVPFGILTRDVDLTWVVHSTWRPARR